MDMDGEKILSIAANTATVIGGTVEGAKTVVGAGKKIREKFKKKNNPLLDRYYNDIMNDLDKDEKSVLTGNGALSNDEVYIDAYSVEYPETKILNTIDRWSSKDDYGVMLIHGEPGHGKTTLCRKAVYEYGMDRFCKDKTNVFWFRLNPAYSDIINKNGELVLENAFCWGNIKSQREIIPLRENKEAYEESIIFLDGYDELKVQAQSINVRLSDFINEVKKYAREYQIHFVVTARTRSVEDELYELEIPTLEFAPMTKEQQTNWIHKRQELYEYEGKFVKLRESSEEMKEMLGIPILFRMVVNARLEDTATGVVELYDKLFRATMERRDSNSETVKKWRQNYQDLAYKIYCNNEQFADIQGKQQADEFLYMFYIKGGDKQHVEFLHRSFYQYFLAHFLYRKMSAVEDEESAEAFLCCLAERQIDYDILDYIQQIQEKKPDVTQEKCEQIINKLEQTGTIIVQALEMPNKNGDAEKHPLLRCENVLKNALSICCIVATAAKSRFNISLFHKKNIHKAMRKYNCSDIWLNNADLNGANLINANLSITNLNGANLTGTGLIGVDLIGVDLTGANLSGADLRWAENLDRCNCEQVADWTGCKILLRDRDNLGLDDPDAHGIIWHNNGTGTPIEP